MKINHLGYVTRNLEEALHSFYLLGYKDMHNEIQIHEAKNLRIKRVQLEGSVYAEVMTVNDTSKPSFIDPSLATGTEKLKINHICYDVDDIHKTFADLLATGEYTIYENITEGVFHKNLIGYLHHKTMGYIEFFEWPKGSKE